MNLSALTLTQLRYLLALDEHRSFRVAALACHVSQPALSSQLQKLEELLGVALFDRSKKPIVPTDAGARLIPQARIVVQETERLADLARCDVDVVAGRYRLGVIPTVSATILPRLLPSFCAAYPEVELVVEEHPTEVLVERLLQDRLDGGLAATPLHVPGIRERPLFREPFWAYLPAGHPLLQREVLSQEDLQNEPLWLLAEGHCFRGQVLQFCRTHCPVSTPKGSALAFEGGTFSTLIGLVDAGMGSTVLPELMLQSLASEQRRQHARPFAAPEPVREVSLLYARSHLRRNVAEHLGKTLVNQLPQSYLTQQGQVLPPT